MNSSFAKKGRGTMREDSGSEERESDGEDIDYQRRTVDKSSSYQDSKSSHHASADHHHDHFNRPNQDNYAGRHYKDFIDEDSNEQSQSQRRSSEKSIKVNSRSENSRDTGRDRQNPSDDHFWDSKETDVDLDSQALLEERVIDAVNDRVDTRLDEFKKEMLQLVGDALASSRDNGSRLPRGNHLTDAIVLTQTQSFVLGSFVRNKIFRIIKVFDKKTLAKEGDTIIEKCKNVMNLTAPTTKNLAEEIMKKVRWYHNKRKGHVRGKIRESVASKCCCHFVDLDLLLTFLCT